MLSSFLSLSNDKQTDVELKHLQWCLKGLETVTCLRLLIKFMLVQFPETEMF